MAPALLLALCGLVLAVSASAATLRLGPSVGVWQSYDSNVRTDETDAESDLATTVAPKLSFVYRGERGSGSAQLEGRFNQYWDQTDLDSFDRSASYDVEYMLTPRFSLGSTARYDYLENTDDYDLARDVVAGRPDTEYLSWSATGRYSLDARTSLSLSPSYSWSEVSDQELPYCFIGSVRVRSETPPCGFVLGPPVDGVVTRIQTVQPVLQASETRVFGGRFGFDRSLTARDTGSLTFGHSLREFERGAELGESSSDRDNVVESALVGWRREWTPTWSTRISLGVESVRNDSQPIDVRDYGFQPVPGGESTLPAFDDTTLIGSGTVGIEYEGRRSEFLLSYTRESYPSVSYGTSLDAQTVRAAFSHRLNSRLTFDAGGYFVHESSIGDVVDLFDAGPNAADPCPGDPVAVISNASVRCLGFSSRDVSQDSLSLSTGLNWQMTRRFSTFLRYSWFDRSGGGDVVVPEYDKSVVTLGFRYGYDIDLY